MGHREDFASDVKAELVENGGLAGDDQENLADHQGQEGTDVQHLLSRISGRSGTYQEIRRQQAAQAVLGRWPLLREISLELDKVHLNKAVDK